MSSSGALTPPPPEGPSRSTPPRGRARKVQAATRPTAVGENTGLVQEERLSDMVPETDAEERLRLRPQWKPQQITDFQDKLVDADGPEAVADLLHEAIGMDEDHVEFLMGISDELGLDQAKKLRETFDQIVLYDLQRPGVLTSSFIPESQYVAMAEEDPEVLAAPGEAKHGVKHRASETDVIYAALEKAEKTLKGYGVDPKEATVFDLGGGTGKPTLIAMNRQEGFSFGQAVSVDYYQKVLEIAVRNIRAQAKELGLIEEGESFKFDEPEDDGLGGQKSKLSLKLEGSESNPNARGITLRFQNAASFRKYANITVVYMYNPFDQAVVTEVEKNLRRYGGRIVVCYNKPEHGHVFSAANGWRTEENVESHDPDKRLTIFSRGFTLPGPAPANGNGATTAQPATPEN